MTRLPTASKTGVVTMPSIGGSSLCGIRTMTRATSCGGDTHVGTTRAVRKVEHVGAFDRGRDERDLLDSHDAVCPSELHERRVGFVQSVDHLRVQHKQLDAIFCG